MGWVPWLRTSTSTVTVSPATASDGTADRRVSDVALSSGQVLRDGLVVGDGHGLANAGLLEQAELAWVGEEEALAEHARHLGRAEQARRIVVAQHVVRVDERPVVVRPPVTGRNAGRGPPPSPPGWCAPGARSARRTCGRRHRRSTVRRPTRSTAVLLWMAMKRSARARLAMSGRAASSSVSSMTPSPVRSMGGSLTWPSLVRVTTAVTPAPSSMRARRRPMSRLRSASRVPSRPTAPSSEPPCPGSMAIVMKPGRGG